MAGTDIHQFLDFEGGADGVAYEARIDAGIARIEQLPFPTIAVVEGWAVGGGLAIATANVALQEASVQRAVANLHKAELDLSRAAELVRKGVGAQAVTFSSSES